MTTIQERTGNTIHHIIISKKDGTLFKSVDELGVVGSTILKVVGKYAPIVPLEEEQTDEGFHAKVLTGIAPEKKVMTVLKDHYEIVKVVTYGEESLR